MDRNDDLKKEIRKKGFKQGFKDTLKIFGDSASKVLGSLGDASSNVLGDGTAAQDRKAIKKGVKQNINAGKKDLFGSIDDVISGMPD